METMKKLAGMSFVTTIKERCRVCYTCVRECPAKAIRIVDGQAEIISERCINCGNCVKVCSQGAKQVLNNLDIVDVILGSNDTKVALVAPSFPAEFDDIDPGVFVGMIRKLGFDHVHEVAFGADLVALAYNKLLKETSGERFIATSCPALIAFVEKYHPDLVGNLAPIVSPMIASSRVVKRLYGDDIRIVFIGPCIAKKEEAASKNVEGEVDVAITFIGLHELFDKYSIGTDAVDPSDFDTPHAGTGSLFPVSRGLLQAANIQDDLIAGDVIATDGRSNFVDAVKEFQAGSLDARLLDILCCNGCVMGAGMSTQSPLFKRRSKVSKYVREYVAKRDKQTWLASVAEHSDLDMSRKFTANDQRIPVQDEKAIAKILRRLGKNSPKDELNCGACGYESCREHAIAIYKHLAEGEMCLPYTIERLRSTIKDLSVSNEMLAETREALQHSEKLASMGQLAAGIAHEVNNPLGVVLMYSHLLLDEQKSDPKMQEDLKLIAEQADRCKKIVSGLLGFARQNKVVLEPTDFHELISRTMMTLPSPPSITVDVIRELDNPIVEIDRDQIIQVLTNLVSNAYAAMPDGGKLTIGTRGDSHFFWFSVSDTGVGIPQENLDKIFEPFFSTKQLGMGTGLGLSVTYGIVKMHYGDIRVDSNADPAAGPTGATFTVKLPRVGRQDIQDVTT